MSIIDDTFASIFSVSRSIGGIIPHVIIAEQHRDTMMITDHPVEKGAAISDHAFMQPLEVDMTVGWSDSTGGYSGAARVFYELLQALQQSREPFTVITGKRVYSNMLIRGLQVETEQHSENILSCTVSLREVIITTTSMTSSSVGSSSAQTSPAKTAAISTAGTQSVTETTAYSP